MILWGAAAPQEKMPQPTANKSSRILWINLGLGAIICVVLIALYFIVLVNKPPLYGWTYSEPISQEFLKQYYGPENVGMGYKVYVDESDTNEPFAHIAVYAAITYPGVEWRRIAEGYFDMTSHTFEWTWGEESLP